MTSPLDSGTLELVKIPENLYENSLEELESFVSELGLFSLIESSAMDSQELIPRPEFRFQCKKQEMIIKALYKQLELSKDRSTRYFDKIRELEENCNKYLKEISRLTVHSEENEKTLLEIIDSKDKELQEHQNKYSLATSRLRTLEFEKEHLQEKYNQSRLELQRYKNIESELNSTWFKLQKSEEAQDKLNRLIYKLSKDPQELETDRSLITQLSLKDQEIQALKRINDELKHSSDMKITSLKLEIAELQYFLTTSQEQEQYFMSKLQELNKNHFGGTQELHIPSTGSECESLDYQESTLADDLFYTIMKKLNLLNESKKVENFTYMVRDKIYSVLVGRDGIFVKNGKNVLSLEQSILEPERSRSSIEERPKATFDRCKILEERRSLEFTGRILEKRKSVDEDSKKLKKSISSQVLLKNAKSCLNKIKSTMLKTPLREQKLKLLEKKCNK
ncbi:hypothetical protein SteCoe_6945 [Stentor coeruleus]|uniref:Uncharacterized protein n=1 Tax=Stentor coeruleus TaxID=5963 RepID=A0A1R2CNV3_9CILI|nr:hypothetical protein SteCoe_6945 [Stentor coeruleus]